MKFKNFIHIIMNEFSLDIYNECCICLDNINKNNNNITTLKCCNNYIHTKCLFMTFMSFFNSYINTINCPLCRMPIFITDYYISKEIINIFSSLDKNIRDEYIDKITLVVINNYNNEIYINKDTSNLELISIFQLILKYKCKVIFFIFFIFFIIFFIIYFILL